MNPSRYRLQLDLDFPDGGFQGRVRIDAPDFSGSETLHCVDLDITDVTVGGRPLPHDLNPLREELHLRGIPAGATTVEIGFRGRVLREPLTGLYASRHGPGTLWTTQFAPVSARRLFPCRDEPAAKAVFDLEVEVPAGCLVVFNTPGEPETRSGSRVRWRFEPTPRMSPYLFYLGVGHFDVRESSGPGRRIRVLTPVGRGASGDWALENARKALEAFERFYGLPYPLPKLDLIAVPDFAAGAMENWGAITFREADLLADETTDTATREEIAETIAHEIAHQWFGNLVTMRWWNDVWLNESFATFASFKAITELYPEWDYWGEFLISWTNWGMRGDSLESTHPIRLEVEDPREIAQIFDEISYGKGATVLRMMEEFLGEKAFWKGVTQYLRAHEYGTATGEDLWKSLEEASGRPVSSILSAWVRQAGHPLVEVHAKGSGIDLHQRRFRYLPRASGETWPIPLVVRDGPRRRSTLVETALAHLPLENPEDFWVNAGAGGFYRISLGPSLREKVHRYLDRLDPRERAAYLRDCGDLFLAGHLSLDQYGSLLEAVSRVPADVVSHVANLQLAQLLRYFPASPKLRDLASRFLIREGQRLGLVRQPGEPSSTSRLRIPLQSTRLWVDPEHVRRLAAELPQASRADPDLRPVIFAAYARESPTVTASELLQRLRSAPRELESYRWAEAMVFLSRREEFFQALDKTVSGEIPSAIGYLIQVRAPQNPTLREGGWDWLVDHLDAIDRQHRGTGHLSPILEGWIPVVGQGRSSEVRSFWERHPLPEGSRGIAKGLELLEVVENRRTGLI
jgi:tricorn protease interacting factor F2/3